MKIISYLTPIVALLWGVLDTAQGHGRLWNPPGRSTMWRPEAGGYPTPKNYNDNQLFCGGKMNQYMNQGGKCGICGDPYQGPRDHEAGGIYANGIIVRSYTQGQVIEVKVEITANHLGWFEFKICPNNDPKKAATQECLDSHVLQLADGSGSKLYIGATLGMIETKVRLPSDLVCTQCVFQWRYHSGNDFNFDPVTGKSCLGCGNQEEFYGCADVSIASSGDVINHNQNHNNNNVGVVPTFQPPVTLRPVLQGQGQGHQVPTFQPPVTRRPSQSQGQGQQFVIPTYRPPVTPKTVGGQGQVQGQGGILGLPTLPPVPQRTPTLGTPLPSFTLPALFQNGPVNFIPPGSGQTNTGSGQTNTGSGQTNTGLGQTNTGSGQTNTGSGQNGANFGTGIGQVSGCASARYTFGDDPDYHRWCQQNCFATGTCVPVYCVC